MDEIKDNNSAVIDTCEQSQSNNHLPQYRVLLHNDDYNDQYDIIQAICDLTSLKPYRAARVMLEAHRNGIALILVTHRERAELYVEQFHSKQITVTIEPTE